MLCEEWKWFEVKIWMEMILRVFWVILRLKGKSISGSNLKPKQTQPK